MTQNEPRVPQYDPRVTQDDLRVTQDDPRVTQDDLRQASLMLGILGSRLRGRNWPNQFGRPKFDKTMIDLIKITKFTSLGDKMFPIRAFYCTLEILGGQKRNE